MKKKILSVLLAVVMLASACSMMIVPVSAATTLSTDNSGAYLISSAADVETFRTMMVGGETFAGKTVKLTTDIDMNNTQYTIANDATTPVYGFLGIFDGQGHTISKLNVSGSNPYNGFFGAYVYKDSVVTGVEIKNVAFVDCTTNSENASYVGLLYGLVRGVDVSVTNVYANITMTGKNAKTTHGGLIGFFAESKLSVSNSVIDVVTVSGQQLGAVVGISNNNKAQETGNNNKITLETTAIYGNMDSVGYTFGACGVNKYSDPEVDESVSNCIIDVSHSTFDGLDGYTGKSTGLLNGLAFVKIGKVTTQVVSGLDATAVEGFTATVGHMVPTSLLKMFPQHCLETSTADGAKVEFEGYQTTNLVDGKAKVRLVATLADDYKNYDEVGFEVVAVYEKDGVKTAKSQKVACTKVYSSISAVTGNEAYPASISASSLIGGEGYIFAMVITGVPEGISLQVRTYSVSGETTTYGATEVFTIADIPGGTVGGN